MQTIMCPFWPLHSYTLTTGTVFLCLAAHAGTSRSPTQILYSVWSLWSWTYTNSLFSMISMRVDLHKFFLWPKLKPSKRRIPEKGGSPARFNKFIQYDLYGRGPTQILYLVWSLWAWTYTNSLFSMISMGVDLHKFSIQYDLYGRGPTQILYSV
jgi:hypothetical protein